MFGKKKETEPAKKPVAARAPSPKPKASPPPAAKKQDNSSILSPHLQFEGKLTFKGEVTINCQFKGNVTTEDHLIIGPKGNVEAEISAGTIEISGKVTGDITASKKVKILSGGEVTGNIVTPSIAMEEGVVFEGQCCRPGSARLAKPTSQPVVSKTP